MTSIGRRKFIAAVGTIAAARPLAVRAQQPALPVIGYLAAGSAESDVFRVTAFRQGLNEAGYVVDRNVTIDHRWAEDHHDRLPAMAIDLVHRQVTMLVATSLPSVLAAKAATTTIPIAFETAADPVKLGLVASLNRPGGNLTGVTQLGEEVLPKRLELLNRMAPSARVMGLLVNPVDPALAEPQVRMSLPAAQTLGIELHVLNARAQDDFDLVFAKLAELRAGGLVIGGNALFTGHNDELAALTVRHAVPAIYQRREFAAAGGLMAYGSNLTDTHRLLGALAGRILKGDNPADLPVQQATKIELFINFKTARALGLTVPAVLAAGADEVIE